LMTSFAFIFGVVPLVAAHGAGAEMRRSLGTAVFAGMLGVTLFGIFLTPVFYYVVQWFGGGQPPAPALVDGHAAFTKRDEAITAKPAVVKDGSRGPEAAPVAAARRYSPASRPERERGSRRRCPAPVTGITPGDGVPKPRRPKGSFRWG
jgi:hypothetical protein